MSVTRAAPHVDAHQSSAAGLFQFCQTSVEVQSAGSGIILSWSLEQEIGSKNQQGFPLFIQLKSKSDHFLEFKRHCVSVLGVHGVQQPLALVLSQQEPPGLQGSLQGSLTLLLKHVKCAEEEGKVSFLHVKQQQESPLLPSLMNG